MPQLGGENIVDFSLARTLPADREAESGSRCRRFVPPVATAECYSLAVEQPHVALPALLELLQVAESRAGQPHDAACDARRCLRLAHRPPSARGRQWPVVDIGRIWQITLSRMRIFYREPGAVFWVYGFPIIMMLALGTAFRDNPKEQITVDVVQGVRRRESRSRDG